MRGSAIVLVLAASLAYGAEGEGMEQTLTLPHSLGPGTNAWLEVQVGPLAAGQVVRVTTRSGELLGTISPYGPAERQHAGSYSLPVPRNAIHGDALSVVVTITEANGAPRTPTSAEVSSVKLLAPDAAR